MLVGAIAPKRRSPPKPSLAAGTMAPRFAAFTDTTTVSLATSATGHFETIARAQESPDGTVVVVDVVVEVGETVIVVVVELVPAAPDGAVSKVGVNMAENTTAIKKYRSPPARLLLRGIRRWRRGTVAAYG